MTAPVFAADIDCPACGQRGWHACHAIYDEGGRTAVDIHPDLVDELARLADSGRLRWMLSQFILSDGAWLATFCFHVHQDGIRAAIDEAVARSKK